MKKYIFIISILLIAGLSSCGKKDEVDKEKPVISLGEDAFPNCCDTLYFGETFDFKALFSDNQELGSDNAFSIDIHNNFDHHAHSTEVDYCFLDSIKTPVNPFLFINSFDIPAGLKEYHTNMAFTIPDNDNGKKYDEGDYHFFISLTDKEGWSTQKGLSIKMLYR